MKIHFTDDHSMRLALFLVLLIIHSVACNDFNENFIQELFESIGYLPFGIQKPDRFVITHDTVNAMKDIRGLQIAGRCASEYDDDAICLIWTHLSEGLTENIPSREYRTFLSEIKKDYNLSTKFNWSSPNDDGYVKNYSWENIFQNQWAIRALANILNTRNFVCIEDLSYLSSTTESSAFLSAWKECKNPLNLIKIDQNEKIDYQSIQQSVNFFINNFILPVVSKQLENDNLQLVQIKGFIENLAKLLNGNTKFIRNTLSKGKEYKLFKKALSNEYKSSTNTAKMGALFNNGALLFEIASLISEKLNDSGDIFESIGQEQQIISTTFLCLSIKGWIIALIFVVVIGGGSTIYTIFIVKKRKRSKNESHADSY